MIKVKLAIGTGYDFAIISGNLAKDIKLEWSGDLVDVDGEMYPLYGGLNCDDSKKIESILCSPNHPKVYKIAKHRIPR